jgi:hypothetical protein
MPLAEADVRASVQACKGEQRVRSAIVKRIFSAVQEHCPPENLPLYHSPVAIRKSLPFRLGRSLALPFFSSLVPRPTTRFKSVSTKTKPAKAG